MPDAVGTLKRTWPQRLSIVAVVISALACFGTAIALTAGSVVLGDRKVISLDEPTAEEGGKGPKLIIDGQPTETTVAGGTTATTKPMVLADPDASNFLVTGADDGDCSSDPTTGDRGSSRSDTIMVWRINPETDQLAVLSFPRDLWVDRPNGNPSRINAAFEMNDPSELIETLFMNFGVPVDHFVQVDFCAFRTLVNAVGGVEVPFANPARDPASLLEIATTGCVNLDGDMAMSYVRSRHYQYEDPAGSGNWIEDPTSDYGRIARQQDFLRRMVGKVVEEGLYTPSVASGLIEANSKYLVTDDQLSVRKMLEFANALKSIDSSEIGTYRIEAYTEWISGQQVERPTLDGENMQAILAVFQGRATMTDAPGQRDASTATTVATSEPGATTAAPATTAPAAAPSSSVAPSTTVPEVDLEDNNTGVAPDPNVTC